MSTRSTPTSRVSADQVFDAVSAVLVGGGLLTMVLFPFALPVILLIVLPLVPIAIVTALAGAIVALPWLLFRLLRSLLHE